MKNYLIDIEDKESLLQTLWDEIEANSSKEVCFVCTPCKNEIAILEENATTPIARINLIKVSDEYDVKRDIFN
jgi:hypothetical protein